MEKKQSAISDQQSDVIERLRESVYYMVTSVEVAMAVVPTKHIHVMDDACNAIIDLRQDNTALTERVRVLEALVKYARHDNDCGVSPCDCGFNAVFNERAALHSPPAQAGQAEGG